MTYKYGKLVLGLVAAAIAGCDSGSFGSDVGESTNSAPIAEVEILNGNGTNEFRTGAEVLLSGKASEDPDGPILSYRWEYLPQAGQPDITLVERNANTVSFTMPNVASGTSLQFQLTVEDSAGTFSSNTVTVVALEALDANRFLSMKIVGATSDPTTFDVSPQLAQQITTEDPTYSVDVQAYLVYPRLGSGADCRSPGGAARTVPTETEIAQRSLLADGDCLVEPQESLTGAGGLAGAWPVGVSPAAGGTDPRHTFDLPLLDVGDFNQPILDADRREDQLELYTAADTYTAIRARITPAAPANLAGAEILANGAPVASSNYDPLSGAPLDLWVLVDDDLLANLPDTESLVTAEAYYDLVDPIGERRTLNRWLCTAGFADEAACAAELAAAPPGSPIVVPFKPDALTGTDTATDIFAHSTYLNNYDLGFGRDMYTRIDPATGYVYGFVNNYATLEGAIRKTDPIVAVVMEFSPPQDGQGVYDTGAPPFVKFYTYAPDGSGDMFLVPSMNFDGRGEIPTPGNCVVCHGGNDPGELANIGTGGSLGATFLPWDPDSLLFLDDDPAISGAPVFLDGSTLAGDLQVIAAAEGRSLDRASQLAQIKKLNEAALTTYVRDGTSATSAAVDLLDVLYGGSGITVVDQATGVSTLNGDFIPEQVPEDWDENGMVAGIPAGSAEFYTNVYALHCRMCHTNIADEALRFDSFAAFAAEVDTMVTVAYERGVMPGARLTADRFWLADHTGVSPGLQMSAYLDANFPLAETPTPPSATAVAISTPAHDDPTTPIPIGARVTLDGLESLFAESYAWTVTRDGAPVTVTGATTASPSFRVEGPGEYSVQLDINGAADSTTLAFTVVNIPPTATNDNDPNSLTLDLTSCATDPNCRVLNTAPFSVLTNDNDPDDPDGDPSDDSSLSVNTTPVSGTQFGALSLSASGDFVYTYDAARSIFVPDTPDTFVYEITDPFGGTAQATVTIRISAAADNNDPTAPTGVSATEASTTGTSSNFRVRLDWTESTDNETGVQGYNIYNVNTSTGARTFREFVDAADDENGSASAFRYTIVNLSNDTAYRFAVSAIDNAATPNESSIVNTNTVTTDISYRLRIDPIFSDAGGFDCSQSGCHSGDVSGENGFFLDSASVTVTYACVRGQAGCSGGTGIQLRDRAAPASSTSQADSRLILCTPSRVCNTNHPIIGFDSSDDEYQRIRRWLLQNSQLN